MDNQSLELLQPRKRHLGQCSSSFAGTDVDYDVFLNYRGPDVKAGFISYLDEALRTAGLNPFLDKASLRKGHPAFSSINDALAVAKIHVAVVSKGYAESKYCLNELVAMLRSGKPVIPVFYKVEPTHLRWVEHGPFAAAFERHKLEETPQQVEEWRDALLKLANISRLCFRLSDHKGNEAELKQEVVNVVLTKVQDLIIKEEAKSLLEEQAVSVVVYEAYKVLETDFTAIMQSTLRMSEHQKFVNRFKNAIARAAKFHNWSYSTSGSWIQQNVSFGIFVEGVRLLLDAEGSTEDGKLKMKALREEAIKLFEEILEDGLTRLEEQSQRYDMLSPTIMETLEFSKKSANTEAVVREFATCARLRLERNGFSHPFSPIASKAVRGNAMALYSSLLQSDRIKDFRHIAVMGKVKLDILEFSKKEKKVDMEDDEELLVESDSCSDSSGEDFPPKALGLWEN